MLPQFHCATMCVMASKLPRVGIRELRQNLSVYVRQVREHGRAYEVTEHGRPVARLTPLSDAPTSVLERMIVDGRATPPRRAWSQVPPPMPPMQGKPLSRILEELRDEERW